MKNSFLRESCFKDKSDIPKTLEAFRKQEIGALLKENPELKQEDIISYYVSDGESIPIETKDDYKNVKNKNEVEIFTKRKADFKPNLVIEQQTFDEQKLETDPIEIEKKYNTYLENAKISIESLLKQKENGIIAKKKELIKKVNEIAQVEKGKSFSNLLLRTYFEEELYNEFKNKLGIILKINQENHVENKVFKCSFCEKDINGEMYKSEFMKKDNYCENCFFILSKFYPSNYSKVLS